MERKKIYISGAMTGHFAYQAKEFFRYHLLFEELGWEVINPAENDMEHLRQANLGNVSPLRTWRDTLDKDVELIREECEFIFMMPGWQLSKGAKEELEAAMECGCVPIFAYELDEALHPESQYLRELKPSYTELMQDKEQRAQLFNTYCTTKSYHQ